MTNVHFYSSLESTAEDQRFGALRRAFCHPALVHFAPADEESRSQSQTIQLIDAVLASLSRKQIWTRFVTEFIIRLLSYQMRDGSFNPWKLLSGKIRPEDLGELLMNGNDNWTAVFKLVP